MTEKSDIMKKAVLTIFFFIIISNVIAQNWMKLTVAATLSAEFPSIPNILNVDDLTIYQITETNFILNITYTYKVKSFKLKLVGSNLDEFYDGIIEGTLVASEDSKLLTEKDIFFEKFKGKEIIYTKDFNDLNDIMVYKRIIIIDGVIFTFEVWNLSDIKQTKIIDKFFNSIKLIK